MTQRVVSELIESNVFVVGDEKNCVVIDAGARLEKVKQVIGNRKVLGVFLTHGHYDHCYYVLDYLKEFDCLVYASKFIKEYLQNSTYNYSEGKFVVDSFENFVFLEGNGRLKLGDIEIKYNTLGGHSKSDMCYQIGEDIFVGDVLLGRDMGRIDLYGGDKNIMKTSLEFLSTLDYKIMHCGHGADVEKSLQDKVAKLWIKFLSR
ncbi:MAG: MBL fold metallo-hydrolase [Candidatus Caccovivens sp.]